MRQEVPELAGEARMNNPLYQLSEDDFKACLKEKYARLAADLHGRDTRAEEQRRRDQLLFWLALLFLAGQVAGFILNVVRVSL